MWRGVWNSPILTLEKKKLVLSGSNVPVGYGDEKKNIYSTNHSIKQQLCILLPTTDNSYATGWLNLSWYFFATTTTNQDWHHKRRYASNLDFFFYPGDYLTLKKQAKNCKYCARPKVLILKSQRTFFRVPHVHKVWYLLIAPQLTGSRLAFVMS